MARTEGTPSHHKHTTAEKFDIVNKVCQMTDLVFKNGKIQRSMGLLEALGEIGIEHITWTRWLNADANLRDIWDSYKRNRLDHMRHQAKGTVEDALYGKMKLKDKEKVDIALRFLEKVDEEFKDRKEITVSTEDFTLSMEDLQLKAKLLIKDLSNDSTK